MRAPRGSATVLALGALGVIGALGVSGALASCGLTVIGDAAPAGSADASDHVDSPASRPEGDALPGPGTVGCAADRTSCDGVCVDTSNDPNHCGTCPTKCATAEVCAAGVCSAACASGQSLCEGRCCTGLCAAGTCKSPVLWLKADVGATTGATFTWADQSGRGNDVTQNGASFKPTIVPNGLAGKTVLRFDDDRLEGADELAFRPGRGDLAWFHVSNNTGGATFKHQVFGTILPNPPHSGITAGYGAVSCANCPYGMLREGVDVFFAATTASTGWTIMDGRRLGGTMEVRRSGTLVASGTFTGDVNGGRIIVGSEKPGGTEHFAGQLAEILLFASSFTNAERASVASYLATRWELPLSQ